MHDRLRQRIRRGNLETAGDEKDYSETGKNVCNFLS